ncbi:hypothetical protein RSF51_000836 [Yersinia enterocolitica]|uniref:Uncharacterized protein n=1 Tax=Yersinia enterocolitica TaxID=630 RepID=A0A0H5G3Z5_YEREN|nr:hypothetical protein [Yersinia enterocolitica]EKN3329262.1 hypothetical protein [Yersinia enterocolitica]EKN3412792.1 hypothetical protein [Yersinia enterocolitica]EKN3495198.1 hypothetical protein [Yersinia enterocolitica]EKN3508005.1 hypothetical protein [Yersinia enterocolitica]EKN3556345.1 hypothetical protein [Yersinia enterocolitica]
MKLSRCPICHTDWHLEALCEDDASRQLLKIIADLPGSCARHLVAYIGLFRREKSNLSNSRALKLVSEVLELYAPGRVLAHALSETVERIREKRALGDKKPLSNHNYLKTVYQSSEQVFAQSSNIAAREKNAARNVVDHARRRDEYLSHMNRLGQDVSTMPGGKEWLARNRGEQNG